MHEYTFRCHTIGHTRYAYFSEKHPNDAAAIARGQELGKGKGKPPPIAVHSGVEYVPTKPTMWYKVEIRRIEGKLIGRWGEWGRTDWLSAPSLERNK